MDNPVADKRFQFAIRIVKLYKHLQSEKAEYVLSKQLLRSGTSIGANVAEAQQPQSGNDFIAKLSIALKETTETKYWLRLLRAADYLTVREAESMLRDCTELEKLLTAIIKTMKQRKTESRKSFSIFHFPFSINPKGVRYENLSLQRHDILRRKRGGRY